MQNDKLISSESAQQRRKVAAREILVIWFMRCVSYFIVLVVALIVAIILWRGLAVIDWEFLSAMPKRSGAQGGILSAIVGTLCLVLGTIAISLPLGMAAAVYLCEYGSQGRFAVLVRLALITLAGVPSVVFGLFGLGLFVVFFGFGSSLIAGSLTLGCMVLPTIIVASEEAIRAIPRGFREASLALGATRWQTIRKIVLPFALPGMLTGSILAVGRAAGETAPIMLTAAAFYLPRIPHSIFDQVMALPYHLYILATQHPAGEKVLPRAYATAVVLLCLVLSVNLIAIVWRSRLRKRYRW